MNWVRLENAQVNVQAGVRSSAHLGRDGVGLRICQDLTSLWRLCHV